MRLLPTAAPLLPLLALALSPGCSSPPLIDPAPTIAAPSAAVVSVSADASATGRDVMAGGGNAVDAAVATAFMLAVTFPEAGNICGGGFMLVHFPDGRDPVCIDYRETAPAAVTERSFADPKDRTPHRLAGVPGTVRGLALAHEKYGKLPWRDLLLPAVRTAREGFALDADKARSLNRVLAAHPEQVELQRVFGKPDRSPWTAGDRLVQPDLANTLQRIADHGPDAFYTGPVAEHVVAEMRRGGGMITAQDLAGYRAKLRKPLTTLYAARPGLAPVRVVVPPPPSSGGMTLIEMLHMLDGIDLGSNFGGYDRPGTIHLLAEVMKRAYADRARFLGDPDFVTVPDTMLRRDHAAWRRESINWQKATPGEALPKSPPLATNPGVSELSGDALPDSSTTHFSVIGPDGMAVSNTYTLEQSYGGKVVVAGAGFLLNNELGDFNPVPGVTTRQGQIGTPANLPAPGKRPLSSMTPTIVTDEHGKALVVTGSPGGRTIINTVLCVLVNRFEFGRSPRECVDAPRVHHQWMPDRLKLEPALHETPRLVTLLKERGHVIDEPAPPARAATQGDAHSIFRDEAAGAWVGVADQRRQGAAAGF